MLRFGSNRWWAFVLALSLFLVCAVVFIAQTPRVAYATQVVMGEDPADQPQPGIGDPDVPIGPGPKPGKTVLRGGALQAGSSQGPVLEGERTTPVSVWMMRLRLYLMGLRVRLLTY